MTLRSKTWRVEFSPSAAQQLLALDAKPARRIRDYLANHVCQLENPRLVGKPLQGKQFAGLWRYRVGDFRILAELNDNQLLITAIAIKRRDKAYK